jgi:hypothetical protein
MKKLYLLICALLTLPFALSAEDTNGHISEGFENMSFNLTSQNDKATAQTTYTDINGNPGTINWRFDRTTDGSLYFNVSTSGYGNENSKNCIQSYTSTSDNVKIKYNRIFVEVKKGTVQFYYRAITTITSNYVKVYKADASTYTLDSELYSDTEPSTAYKQTSEISIEEDGMICIEVCGVYLDDYTNDQLVDKAVNITGQVYYKDAEGVKHGVKNSIVYIGTTSTTCDEDGKYSLQCYKGEGRTIKVECPYDQENKIYFGVPSPEGYTLDVIGDTEFNIQVLQGRDGTQHEQFAKYTFNDWVGTDSTIISDVTQSDGWGYIPLSGNTYKSNEIVLEVEGSEKWLRGSGSTTESPKAVFPVKGSDKSGCTISFMAKGSTSSGTKVEFYAVTANDDGSFTAKDLVATVDLSNKLDYSNFTGPYTAKLNSDVVRYADNQYLAMAIYKSVRVDNLTVEYDKAVGVEATLPLKGTIKAGSDPVEGAEVTITTEIEPLGTFTYTTTTDADGNYEFTTKRDDNNLLISDDVAGNLAYTITVSKTSANYQPVTVTKYFIYDENLENYTYDLNLGKLECSVTYYPNTSVDSGNQNTGEAASNPNVVLTFYDPSGERVTDNAPFNNIFSMDRKDTNTQINDKEGDYTGYSVHATLHNYYMTTVPYDATDNSAAKGVNTLPIENNKVNIYLHPQGTGGSLVDPINEKDYHYILISFDNHKLSFNKEKGTVIFEHKDYVPNSGDNNNSSQSTAPRRTETSSSTEQWSSTRVPMVVEQDGNNLRVYKDMKAAWNITLENYSNYTLTFPAGSVTIDDYVCDYNLDYTIGIETDVFSIDANTNPLVDVYTTSGILVHRGIDKNNLDQLPAGIYIVRAQDKTYKMIQR